MPNKTTIHIGHVENINPNVKEVRSTFIVNNMTEQDKKVKQAMAYAIDYCQRNGTNVTTEEVWQQWCEDCEEAY